MEMLLNTIFMTWLLTFLLLLDQFFVDGITYESLDEDEKQLMEYLKNSSVLSRPVNKSMNNLKVNVTMLIVRLDSVSEKGQSVRMKLHINFKWHNPFSHWNARAFGGISEVILPEKAIWTPPIQLFNEAGKKYGDGEEVKPQQTVLVSSDGTCSLTFAKYFKSTCEIDVSHFPFDDQICDLVFGSWSMDERMLSLRAVNKKAIDSNLFKENGEWDLAEATLEAESVKYEIHTQSHSTIHLKINLVRKNLYFIMNLVVPCAMIACMIFLVFVLPAKSGERISLGITVMLSMAIFQELSSEKLPSSSDNYPLLGIYYTTSMCEIGLALAANCLILNVFYREYEMPRWLRRLLFDKLSRIVRIDVPFTRMQSYLEKTTTVENFRELDTLSDISTTSTTASRHHKSNKNSIRSNISNGNPDITHNQTLERSKFNNSKVLSFTDDPGITTEERKLLAEDWKRAARILDRVMLIVATCIGVLSFIVIFCHAPRFRDMFTVT